MLTGNRSNFLTLQIFSERARLLINKREEKIAESCNATVAHPYETTAENLQIARHYHSDTYWNYCCHPWSHQESHQGSFASSIPACNITWSLYP